MRGLSTLSSSRAKQKGNGLMTLEDRFTNRSQMKSNLFYSQEELNKLKSYYPCAYHVGEKITNFCINENCLLPLCPKCVKIHSEEHQKMGVHGNFSTVQQCLQQSQQTQNQNITRLQQMVSLCQQLATLHKQQIQICTSQLSKAKQQLIEYIDTIFGIYQQQTNKLILETSKEYEQHMIMFHKEIVALMMDQKRLAKKAENQNTKLEFLIDFYSKQDVRTLLNSHAASIQSVKPKYLELTVNTYELQRIKVVLKKYLDFGQFAEQVDMRLQNNLAYNRATLVTNSPGINQISQPNFSFALNTENEFVRTPIRNLFNNTTPNQLDLGGNIHIENYGFKQKGEISRLIEEKLSRQSLLDKFQSPLQAYSLEKSRRS